jgi:APA family basic amino acid/polyamine antiporter
MVDEAGRLGSPVVATVEDAVRPAPRGELLRILGVPFGIATAVGGMIGVGILRAPSVIAAEVPDGRVIVLLWVLGAIFVAVQANVMSELATAIPRAGGPYIYVRRALGDVGGLAVGWTDWMAFVCGIAALSVAFAEFLGILWPAAAHVTPITAVAVQVVIFGMNAIGLRQGTLVQHLTSLLKALALVAFCVAAAIVATRMHRDTPVPQPMSHIGWFGLIAAFQLIAGAYSGWNQPTYFSEENREPGRSIPRAMGIGLILTAALYISVNVALLAALGARGTAQSALPFTSVLTQVGGAGAGIVFAVCALLSVASCANAGIMAAPRILLALSRDGLLPRMFQAVNKGGSPHFAFALTAIVSIALTLTGSFDLVFGLLATLNAAMIILVIVAYFVLRRRDAELHRPFRAIAHPWLPAIALISNLVFFALFLNANWLGGLYAAIMWVLCIPFALVARRVARRTPSPAVD